MRRFVPILVLICLLAAAVASPAVAAPGPHSATVGDARPLPGFFYQGVLTGPGYEDLWMLDIAGGQQVIIEMIPPDGEDFRLALWPPGTADLSDLDGAVATSMDAFDPQALKYVAPRSGGGTYYIDVWSWYSSVDDPSYTLKVDLQSPTNNVRVTAPAVPVNLRVNKSYTSWGTLSPRHFPGDESVTVEWQKYSKGRWRVEATERVENVDRDGITRFKVEYSFYGWGSGKMHWRVRAIHRADELHPRKVSTWRYFWVKV